MAERCLKNRDLAVFFQSFLIKSGSSIPDLVYLSIDLNRLLKRKLYIVFYALELALADLIGLVGSVYLMLLLTEFIRKFIYFIDPNADFQRFLFV